jgi:hypothetical protein
MCLRYRAGLPRGLQRVSTLPQLGWYIAQHERLMAHWRVVLSNPLLTVNLQDWVEDFTGTSRRVLDFLGLPACERFYERDSRVRTVSR